MNRKLLTSISVGVVLAAAIVVFVKSRHKPPASVATSKPLPASKPATTRAMPPVAEKPPDFLDVVRQQNPLIASTQPLAFAVELPDAAHFILHDPMYLDPSGHLWITRADGQVTARALDHPTESTEHVIRDRPLFAHWSVNSAGNWRAALVVRNGDALDLVTNKMRQRLGADRAYRWASAFSLTGSIVVPTDSGVTVFEVDAKVPEHFHAVPGCTPAGNPPVTLPDTRGVLAWAPWENHKPGSTRVCRFVDGTWTDLPAEQWPRRPIQLSILLDGSVLRIAVAESVNEAVFTASTRPSATKPTDSNVIDQKPVATRPASTEAAVVDAATTPDVSVPSDLIALSVGQLEGAKLDDAAVDALIVKLGNIDGDVRAEAFTQLSQYGPTIAPLLQKAVGHQRPEARRRIEQLMKKMIAPGLGELTPIENRLDVVRRFPDGTVLYFAPAGVLIPTENEDPDVLNPAWLAQRGDGRFERPLPAKLVHDQRADACTLLSVRDEWLRREPAGFGRFLVTDFDPLLTATEKRFSEVVGIGQHRRWIFTDPAVPNDSLIIDPMLADPTPKLPVWTLNFAPGAVGWDRENFPAINREDNAGKLRLTANGWSALPEGQDLFTDPQVILSSIPTPPASTEPASTQAVSTQAVSTQAVSTQPVATQVAVTQPAVMRSVTTRPVLANVATEPKASTRPMVDPSLGPMLLDSSGIRYFGGQKELIVVNASGIVTRWSLPPTAQGEAKTPVLIETPDKLLFLFNQSGRLLRIQPTPLAAEPFAVEATFTHDIPEEDHPLRIWIDPEGRLDWISETGTLSVMFPSGHIPRSIANMMLETEHAH